ncbi:hypothetical protein KJQ98_10105, partial [Campylobacter sp. 2018MI27]|nr:hypothetical protein [Campylobacter sp. 2018MI27]
MIIIFALYNYFFRTIPDYSSKTHERIVTLSDYKKYQQGYCLKEDRILPKDELYKRVVVDHFVKQQEYKKIYTKMRYNETCECGYYIQGLLNTSDAAEDHIRTDEVG